MPQNIIWITGASTGIGKELATVFSKAGNIVVVTARRKSRLVAIVSEIKFAEREAAAFVCNVASERSVQRTVRRIREKYGRIDCLINNAGITTFKSFLDTKVWEFDNIISTNLRGTFLCIKYVLPHMLKSRKGHIINLVSVAANTVLNNSAAYSASKAGILSMTNVIRKEIRKQNIKITNIYPGATETPMWDSRSRQKYHNRMMSPADIAKIILQTFEQPKKVMIEDVIIKPIKGDI